MKLVSKIHAILKHEIRAENKNLRIIKINGLAEESLHEQLFLAAVLFESSLLRLSSCENNVYVLFPVNLLCRMNVMKFVFVLKPHNQFTD